MRANMKSAFGQALVLVLVSTSAVSAGDAKKGEKAFNKCKTCHIVEATGPKKIGPSLAGLFGRRAGTLPGFKYSDDMKAAGEKGLIWTDETFVAYMENTKSFIGGIIGKKRAKTSMAFAGIKKASERDDLLAYLKQATK